MNQGKQPEALRLADKLETSFSVRDRWSASCHLRHLYGRVQELESELVKEAARTAEQKLRADQMSQQHSTQAALNSEARKELAEIKLAATQPAAQGLDAPNEWEGIHTMPTCDDLIWLYCQDTNTIDGPIAPDPSLEQYGWTHWAYANAPSTAGIDSAQAKQGGA